jgi:hypothetical protein
MWGTTSGAPCLKKRGSGCSFCSRPDILPASALPTSPAPSWAGRPSSGRQTDSMNFAFAQKLLRIFTYKLTNNTHAHTHHNDASHPALLSACSLFRCRQTSESPELLPPHRLHIPPSGRIHSHHKFMPIPSPPRFSRQHCTARRVAASGSVPAPAELLGLGLGQGQGRGRGRRNLLLLSALPLQGLEVFTPT